VPAEPGLDDSWAEPVAWPGLALHRAAVEGHGLGPAVVQSRLGGHGHRLCRLASQVEQGRQQAGVGGVTAQQGAEDDAQDVRDLAEESACLRRRLCGGVLQHHRQVVRQLTRR
jgi:hypothetical protein